MDKSKVDAVRSEADKVLDRVKRMKAQYLSMPSDQPDLIRDGQMRFKVKDHTFRDVYARGNLDTSSPKTIVWMIPTLAVILLQLMLLVLIPSILMMASPQAEGHYFKVILALYLMPLAGWIRSAFCIGISYALYKGIKVFAERYWESQNVDSDKTLLDNDEYSDASRIRQPEELAEDFDIFPDAGAHSKTIDVTAILGHIMLSNAGVHKIEMPLRAEKDEEIDGMEVHKNELLYDENDELVKVSKSMIDETFGDQLWDSSLLPRPYGKNAGYIKKILRHRYDPDDLEYNPSKQYGKSKEATVAEKINNDWYMPIFEVQRPGGMYIVDTEPNNTMVLAMTRAGKGIDQF